MKLLIKYRLYPKIISIKMYRFWALMAVNNKITIFWSVMPCSLVARNQNFGRRCFLSIDGLTDSSIMLVRKYLPNYRKSHCRRSYFFKK
jgi:hypothetical protein